MILGLNVQARTWEAPTKDLIALNQARKALGNHTFGEDKRTRAMTALLNEVRARGGDDADTIKVLRDLVDRKITEEEAEKKMKAIADGQKPDSKGASLAEQEELARLEIKAQQLILQKLVGHKNIIKLCTLLTMFSCQELQRREEQRKEVEEIQKRIREKSLPIRLSRHVSTKALRCWMSEQDLQLTLSPPEQCRRPIPTRTSMPEGQSAIQEPSTATVKPRCSMIVQVMPSA